MAAFDDLKNEKAAIVKRLALIEKGERLAAELAELRAEDEGVLGLVLSTIQPQQRPPDTRRR